MKNIKKISLIFTFFSNFALAQSDTMSILTFEKYMDIVKKHHPVTQQAQLQVEKGDASVQSAKGAFDPYLSSKVSQKYFKDSQYYSLFDGGFKIPTRLGLIVESGYEQNQGIYLNPENNVPANGLLYAGVTLPIGQGLFIDKRRATLQQAKLYQKSTTLERQLMLNELIYEAGKAYWDWFMAYNTLEIYQEALLIAEERYNAVQQSAILGDRPAIDTIEAGIQVQNRELNFQEAKLNFINTSAQLSIFLWSEGTVPLKVAENTAPYNIEEISAVSVDESLQLRLDTLILQHPQLQQYRYKIDQLNVDLRWKKEQLKPVLNLKYNAINEPINGNPLENYSTNNYTWGLELGIPILLRKERGNLKLAKIKIQEASLDLKTKNAFLTYKAEAALNELTTTKEQIELYRKTVQDYNRLLQGERTMFEAGESSLFMVNAREMGYINTQIKLIELVAKNHKANLKAQYTFGTLN